MNKQGPIRHTVILRMEMGEEHTETTEMAVTNIGRHDILLGTDWFRAHNPQIDWAKNNLRLDRCPTSCYPNYLDKMSELAQLLPTEELEAHYDDLLESNYQGIDPTQCIMAHLHREFNDMIQPSESVVSPMMSPSKKSIVALQHNMAKYEPVVSPTVSITRRHGPVVSPTVPPKTASQNASPRYGPVVTPTVPPKNVSRHASPRIGPVVTSTVPSKSASWHASPRIGPVVTSTVPPKSASWHATPQPTTASRHAPIQAEPVVSPTVSYMNAAWHALTYPELVVTRTTVSTTLAKAEQPKNVKIPPKFRRYNKVFSDEEAQRLPKHQPWDHKIDLIPGMEMKKTTVYHLTPIEKVTLKEYIEDGLKRGTLRRSKAPHACSFFFIDKKDGKLQPVQDYRPLNAITVKNAAPIPLIPKLVNKLLGARFFTKLDVRWGYNNIRVREGDEWKTAFKTPMGLYESTVMTFGLCNAPTTFQTFMDIEFGPLIKGGHVVVYLDDILIYATTITELIYWTHQVFQLLLKLDLYL